ncbi:choloylglycine hydrolase family protein [Phocaeicola vulgatus]|uniref:choloylglycine hydrolase family protein n=1 Tax=Phocaeicola vulgatus TaxID=821 RepID=UPI0032C02FA2
MVMKKILIALALLLTGIASGSACTGISFLAEDGGYVQARTIEWGDSYLPSEYVIVPRGQDLVSYTPTGVNGLRFRAKYGLVGLAIIQKEFVAEGLNEVGLSAGLFYFPHYGKYEEYDEAQNAITLSDLQVVNWMLSQFATIDEVREAIEGVKVVSLDKPGKSSTVHWRIGDAKGNQMVLEFVGGVPYFYENKVGVLTNSPDFPWQVTNLNNYVNLYPGAVTPQQWGGVTIFPFGAGAGFHGIPGDVIPPSRFVRVAFYKATAPVCPTAYDAILQSFHILNNFDIPIGIEHALGKAPDIPSATQWTSAIDLTNRKVYYKTAYNNNIRCISMKKIDFDKVKYQSYPLDKELKQPVEEIIVK